MKMVAMTLRWHGGPSGRIARRVPKLVRELGGDVCNVEVDHVRTTRAARLSGGSDDGRDLMRATLRLPESAVPKFDRAIGVKIRLAA
jgi:hypothetical protein